MALIFRECVMDDLATLQEISYKTFSDTFGCMNTATNMKAYLEQAFNIDKLCNELSNPNSSFYFLYSDNQLAGYLKLNEYKAQTDIYDPQSLEIERIYVLKEFQGKGFGSFLIKKAIDIANMRKNICMAWCLGKKL